MTICVVHCVTPLDLKTAGIDSPPNPQRHPAAFTTWRYLQSCWTSCCIFLYSHSRWHGLGASFARSIRVPGCGALFCLLGVHGWGRSYKCLIVFGNRDDGAPASGPIDMFPRCFVWKKHPVAPLDAWQRNHRSASAARKSRRQRAELQEVRARGLRARGMKPASPPSSLGWSGWG